MSQTEEIGYLENRLADNPDSTLFARLAEAYIGLGRTDEALELCRRGLERHPQYATGHMVYAKALWKKGELEEAEKSATRALELEPHSLWALKLRGDILRAMGWIRNAEMNYRQILEFDPLEERARAAVEDLRGLEEEIVTPSVGEEEEVAGVTAAEELVGEMEEPVAEETAEEAAETVEDLDKVLDDIFETEEEVPSSPDLALEEETVAGEEVVSPFEEAELEEAAPEAEAVVAEEAAAAEEELKEIFGEETAEAAVEEEREIEQPAEAAAAEEEEKEEERREAPELEEAEGRTPRPSIVTPTLGEIYAAQGQYAKAIGVFEVLREKEPDNPEWPKKIEMLKKKLAESQSEE